MPSLAVRRQLRQTLLPIVLTLLSMVVLVLGSRRTASGASCGAQFAGRACAQQPVSGSVQGAEDSSHIAAGGSGALYLQTQPAAGLLALQLSILSGSGLPQAPQTQVRTSNATGVLHWPVSGPVTQLFGVPELGVGSPHTGVDIGQEAGSPVRAAQAGRVTFAGGDPCCGLGYWVEINHGDHYSTRYGHLMRPPVVLPGDFLSQGQILGFSGNTGFSTGPHVHFELRYDGGPVDPLRIIPAR
ncbi:MAG TPA: M23 family metallopeptidase [Dehalococcoidia bacterium]|nr:M23 family metallopeptidase [Dehalococcoidia bacterium]